MFGKHADLFQKGGGYGGNFECSSLSFSPFLSLSLCISLSVCCVHTHPSTLTSAWNADKIGNHRAIVIIRSHFGLNMFSMVDLFNLYTLSPPRRAKHSGMR